MNKVSIVLGEEALLALQEVLLDESEAGALEFLKKHVAPKIPKKGTALCDSSRLNPFIFRDGQGPSAEPTPD